MKKRVTCEVLVFESSFYWHSFLFPLLFCSNSAQKYYFSEIPLVCDGRTDTPSYSDASKKENQTNNESNISFFLFAASSASCVLKFFLFMSGKSPGTLNVNVKVDHRTTDQAHELLQLASITGDQGTYCYNFFAEHLRCFAREAT